MALAVYWDAQAGGNVIGNTGPMQPSKTWFFTFLMWMNQLKHGLRLLLT
jgi:hypothetical protein